MAAHRRRWRVWQRYMDPAGFVFLDEAGASTNMVRRYGWGPKGNRLVDAAPHGHWRTTTFVAGLRSTGIVAPLVLGGPMRGDTYRAYVEQFLPSYSPDLNPIEQLFAKLKALLRETAARTLDALWNSIGAHLGTFSEPECRNYLRNSGYTFD